MPINVKKNRNNQPVDGDYTKRMDPPPAPTIYERPIQVIKTPTRDVTNISDLVPDSDEETIARLLFEQFSAVEISQILTPRTIEGVGQQYSIISNLSDIKRTYSSGKQLSIMDKLSPISGVFAIDISSKIPDDDYIINNNLNVEYQYYDENNDLASIRKDFLYIDTNGDLIIELNNVRNDEIVQIQIDTDGSVYEIFGASDE